MSSNDNINRDDLMRTVDKDNEFVEGYDDKQRTGTTSSDDDTNDRLEGASLAGSVLGDKSLGSPADAHETGDDRRGTMSGTGTYNGGPNDVISNRQQLQPNGDTGTDQYFRKDGVPPDARAAEENPIGRITFDNMGMRESDSLE